MTGSSNYTVTGLVRWERALASVPSIPGSTAGLAILRVSMMMGALEPSQSVAGSQTQSQVASKG